ncbi:MAG: urease accessory protein UreD [Sulfitobacter sp.]|nr:urease accessory protein UreD [Sulfitobacter sp.]
MSFLDTDIAERATGQPRARGMLRLSVKRLGARTVIDRFQTSGATKVLFPRSNALEAIQINTAGGLTGGDRFATDVDLGSGCDLTLTTQAAERAYRSSGGTAQIKTRLRLETGARLCWLPQEMIVFDGSALDRHLSIELAEGSRLLMVESIVFGRTAMGERLNDIALSDRIEVRRAGRPIYLDRIRIVGDAEEHLSQPAVCRDARAMASLVYCAPDAEWHLPVVRAQLPQSGGASLLSPDLLALRLLAGDGFLLRRSLLPILETLRGNPLPRSWSL